MSCNSSLPQPIRDPSGKIYIAIPAPSFVFAQNASAQAINSAPGYVYVEYNPSGPHGLPEDLSALEQNSLADLKPSVSIDKWMIKNCTAEPPPGHIPWTSGVLHSTSSASICALSDESLCTTFTNANLASSMHANSSISSFEIPSVTSDETLFVSSLPSACSSAWSGGHVPPSISEAKFALKSDRSKPAATPIGRKSRFTVKSLKPPDKRRFTMCVPVSTNHREAHVFNRRLTLAKTEVRSTDFEDSCRSSPRKKILSQIDDLDDFFSEGLKKMDLTMSRLTEKQKKVDAPPSLVVSTSSAVLPVSLESYGSLNTSYPSLAQRRGMDIPLVLKLDNRNRLDALVSDYPDLPTAYRGSPEPTSETFFEAPNYPTIKLDTKMTTEQMICSLREQVENFHPERSRSGGNSDVLMTHCRSAEVWLEDELERSPCKSRSTYIDEQGPRMRQKTGVCDVFRDDDLSFLSHMFPDPPRPAKNTARINVPQVGQFAPRDLTLSSQRSLVRLPTENLKNWNSKIQTPKAKPRKSILSNGSVSSCSSSTKKVRFSNASPSVIPPLQDITQKATVPTTPRSQIPVTSPKRKPVPLINSIESPTAARNSLQPTPTKSSITRKLSPLNRSVQIKSTRPTSRPHLKRCIEPVALPTLEKCMPTPAPRKGSPSKKGPLLFSSAANTSHSKEATDDGITLKKPTRPMSVGANLKENRDRSLSDKLATITKRKSYAAIGNKEDKENLRDSKIAELVAREAQKKGGRRNLPFQNVLSRLRG